MDAGTVEWDGVECMSTGRVISPGECFQISSSSKKNREHCYKSGCMSPFRLCLSCVANDEVDSKSVVVKPGSNLCLYHETHGYNIRKDGNPEKAKEARKLQLDRLRRRVEDKRIHAEKKAKRKKATKGEFSEQSVFGEEDSELEVSSLEIELSQW